MKKYVIIGFIMAMFVCVVTGCTRLTNPFFQKDKLTTEITTVPPPDSTTVTTTEPGVGTVENPVGLNETFYIEYSTSSKHYIEELTLTEVIRGQSASDLIYQASKYPLYEANENEEYILLKFHAGYVSIENFINPLGFYSIKILQEDGTCCDSYSSKGIEDLLNIRYHLDVDFAVPGSTDVYALFIVPKNQAKLAMYNDHPKIYFSLE